MSITAGRSLGLFMAIMACLMTPGCSSGSSASGSEAGNGAIAGEFDVGGHRLYLNCAGTGTLTVIYLHGSIVEPSVDPHSNGMGIRGGLSEDYRVCVYDRRNVAHSDTVQAPQSPDDALTDLQNLLAAA